MYAEARMWLSEELWREARAPAVLFGPNDLIFSVADEIVTENNEDTRGPLRGTQSSHPRNLFRSSCCSLS